MIHGEPITMMEIQNKNWFISDLLKGGFETAQSVQVHHKTIYLNSFSLTFY